MTHTPEITPLEKLGDARAIVRKKAPYFRKAVLSLVPVMAPGLGTVACTDRYVLMYDPEFIAAQSVNELAGCLVHEISHLLRGHHKRMDHYPDRFRANVAGDIAMNPDIRAMGFNLPTGAIYPATFNLLEGKSLEEYYGLLPKDQSEDPGSGQGDGQGDSDSDQDSDQGDGQGDTKGKPKKQKGSIAAGHCGSCAGNAVPNEPQDEALGRTDTEIARIGRETAEAVREYVGRKGQDSVPGGWQRWADVTLGIEQVPWQNVLARKIHKAIAFRPGARVSSYAWPNKRQSSLGWGPGKPILAGTKAKVPHVCVVIDTSGSMGTKDIQDAINETHGILKAVGANIEFIACDAAVACVAKLASAKQIGKHIRGGGGTDFHPIFDLLKARPPKKQPEILIYITDGGGYGPNVAPHGMRVIWALVGAHRIKPLTHNGQPICGETLEVG